MPAANLNVQRTSTSVPHNPALNRTSGEVDPVGLTLMIAFPVLVIYAIVGYRKHRASVLRRRINLLNRIWQLDALKKQP